MVTLPLLLARHKVIFLWPWKTGGAPGAKTHKMGGRGPQGVFNPPARSILSFQNFTEVPLSFLCWLQKLLLQLNWSIILYIHLLSTFQGGGKWPQFSHGSTKCCWFLVCSAFFPVVEAEVTTYKFFTCSSGIQKTFKCSFNNNFFPLSLLRRKRMW